MCFQLSIVNLQISKDYDLLELLAKKISTANVSMQNYNFP